MVINFEINIDLFYFQQKFMLFFFFEENLIEQSSNEKKTIFSLQMRKIIAIHTKSCIDRSFRKKC